MPIAGFTRFRQWAFSAAQSAHGTAATPTGALPWSGPPVVDPHWTDLDNVDVGSIDPYLTPYRTQTDITAALTGPLDYDSLSPIGNFGIRGGVAAVGGAANKTWTHTALSLTQTTLDEASAQWGDDFGQDDYRFRDGVIEKIEYSVGEDLGPWQVATQWYFGYADPHVTRVTGLQVASNLPLVFGADTALFIDSTAAGIGATQISNALHSAKITITNTIDKKRFMNGSNTRFAVAGYGLAMRVIDFEFTFAKTTAIAGFSSSEMRNWLNADPVNRYLNVVSTSRQNIPTTATPYSWSQKLAGTWRTRADGAVGNNSVITLVGRAQYDTTLGYPYQSVTVNGNATLP